MNCWSENSSAPSSSRIQHMRHAPFPKIKKVLIPPWGNKDRNGIFLRYHLDCRRSGRSAQCQHTVCPVTGANRKKILRRKPVPSALGGPFAAPLFTPLSAPGALCGCACSFISASAVCIDELPILNTSMRDLSSPLRKYFFRGGQTFRP